MQEAILNKLVEEKRVSPGSSSPGNGWSSGTLIFVEHPHVYTLGKSGQENNLLIDNTQLKNKGARFIRTDRGGDITYHGPGQLVGYPIFDLEKIGIGLKDYIYLIEEAIINSISEIGVTGSRIEGATGIWIKADEKGGTRKICAIGVRVSRFITMHGFALNVNTDLSYFGFINPCGFTDKGVSSLENETGTKQDFAKVKLIVKENLRRTFGLNWIN